MSQFPQVELDQIFEIARGGSPRPIDRYITEDPNGVNWVMIGDAKEGSKYISSTKKRIIHEGVSRSRKVFPGDFLLTNSMSFGKPYILKTSGCIHDGWLVLSPRTDRIDPDYMYHLLGSDLLYAEFEKRAAGAVVKNLNSSIVKTVKIPLPHKNGKPDLAEQKRIAAILDKADAIRLKRQQALYLTDDFLRAVFHDMFGDPVTNPKGWKETTVSEELEFLTSGSRGWAKYYAEEGDLFIRIQNLRGGILDLSDAAYVDAPESAEAKRTRVQAGDVLLSITADLGRTAVVPNGIGKAHINQHIAILRFESLNPVFVSHLLATPGGQKQFETLNRSAVKAGLNFDDIRSIRLLFPPAALQEKFASIVEKVTEFERGLKASGELSSDSFQSFQQRAFRGEL